MKFVKTILVSFLLFVIILWVCYLKADSLLILIANQALQEKDLEVSTLHLEKINFKVIKIQNIDLHKISNTNTGIYIKDASAYFSVSEFRFNLQSLIFSSINLNLVGKAKRSVTEKLNIVNKPLLVLQFEKWLPQIWLPAVNVSLISADKVILNIPAQLNEKLLLSNLTIKKSNAQLHFTMDPIEIREEKLSIDLHINEQGDIAAQLFAIKNKKEENLISASISPNQVDSEHISVPYKLDADLSGMYRLLSPLLSKLVFFKKMNGTLSSQGNATISSQFSSAIPLSQFISDITNETELGAEFQFSDFILKSAKVDFSSKLELSDLSGASKPFFKLQVEEASKISASCNQENKTIQDIMQLSYLCQHEDIKFVSPSGSIFKLENGLFASDGELKLSWGDLNRAVYAHLTFDSLSGTFDNKDAFSGQAKYDFSGRWNKSLAANLAILHQFEKAPEGADFKLDIIEDNTKIEIHSAMSLRAQNLSANYQIAKTDFSYNNAAVNKLAQYLDSDLNIKEGSIVINGGLETNFYDFKAFPSIIYDFSLTLADTDIIYDTYAINGINFSSELTGKNLIVSTTESTQLKISQVLAGVPITNIRFDADAIFDLNNNSFISVSAPQAEFLGGKASSNAFMFRIQHPPTDKGKVRYQADILVKLDDIELKQVLALLENKEIEGDGILYGRLPIYVDEKVNIIDEGWVKNKNLDGTIRYNPNAETKASMNKKPQMKLMLDVLGHLNYNKLEADINLERNGALRLEAHLHGKNPDFQKGYPVNLNTSIELNFKDMLKSLQIGQDISESLTKKITHQQLEATP